MCVLIDHVPGCLTSCYVCSSCSRLPHILLCAFLLIMFQVASHPAMCVRHVPGCLTACHVCLSCSRLPHILLCVFVMFQVASHPAMCVRLVPGCLTSCYVCSYRSCSRLPHFLLCVFLLIMLQAALYLAMCVLIAHVPGCLTYCYVCSSDTTTDSYSFTAALLAEVTSRLGSIGTGNCLQPELSAPDFFSCNGTTLCFKSYTTYTLTDGSK